MRKFVQATCILAVCGTAVYAQTFEVATIKVIPPGERRQPVIDPKPGTLTMRDVGFGELLMWSFKIGPAQVANPQVAMGPERFDIMAKAAGPAKTDELGLMLQALLKERFKFAFHRETKEISAYVLVEAKGGHKLKESMEDGSGVLPVSGGRMALSGHSATLDQLTMFLAGPLRTPVVDQTGLKGRYDFEFDLTDYRVKEHVDGEPPPDPVAILQSALPKQLGLRLESRKMPIEMLIIDHIEKTPVEN